MGRIGKQAQGEILPADGGGKTPVAGRDGEVEPDGGRHRRNFAHEAGGDMRLWSRFRSWLQGTMERSRLENEMDTELRFHVEAHAEELMRTGLPREEALRRARLEFGGMETAKEECRETARANLLESLIQDMRYGMRMMWRTPGFTVTAVLALALGIGANTAIFSVVNAVLLRPVAFDQRERLMQIWHTPPQASFPGIPTFAVSPAN